MTYALLVTNRGPLAATAVRLVDALPPGVDFLALGGADAGGCAVSNGVLTCEFGGMAAGAAAAVTLRVQPRELGLLTNAPWVTAAEIDLNPADSLLLVRRHVTPQRGTR